jgi:hypothetical protein
MKVPVDSISTRLAFRELRRDHPAADVPWLVSHLCLSLMLISLMKGSETAALPASFGQREPHAHTNNLGWHLGLGERECDVVGASKLTAVQTRRGTNERTANISVIKT